MLGSAMPKGGVGSAGTGGFSSTARRPRSVGITDRTGLVEPEAAYLGVDSGAGLEGRGRRAGGRRRGPCGEGVGPPASIAGRRGYGPLGLRGGQEGLRASPSPSRA